MPTHRPRAMQGAADTVAPKLLWVACEGCHSHPSWISHPKTFHTHAFASGPGWEGGKSCHEHTKEGLGGTCTPPPPNVEVGRFKSKNEKKSQTNSGMAVLGSNIGNHP